MDDNEIKRRLSGRAAEYMMFKNDEEDTEVLVDITSTGNVIVFPDFEKLKNEVEKMRTELSMLLLERDELQFVICKNIETEYMLKLGSIEYRAYEAQCLSLRLKRKIELIQAKKNRQEKVIISAIEEVLDNEFVEYQKQLDEQITKMNDALKRSKAELLTDEENKELKKLYRKIVKALHPDINPDVSETQVNLFDNAVQAYKNGDLVKSGAGGLMGLLHGSNGELTIPKPFEKDIFLFDTYVAGTTHIEGIEELERHLNSDDKLEFFREADNQYDKQAIVIKTIDGVKIGYVPKQDNVIFARLMDAGKLLFGKITSKENKGSWVKIYIKVFLHE